MSIPKDKTSREIDIYQAVSVLKDYWITYDQQSWYETYSDETFLADALYAIGVAINDDRYRGADGFNRFIEDLKKELFSRALKGNHFG